jgi:hypothetical protein
LRWIKLCLAARWEIEGRGRFVDAVSRIASELEAQYLEFEQALTREFNAELSSTFPVSRLGYRLGLVHEIELGTRGTYESSRGISAGVVR